MSTPPTASSLTILPQRARLMRLIGVALLALGSALLALRIAAVVSSPSDFTQDYMAALALRSGQSIYANFTDPGVLSGLLATEPGAALPKAVPNFHPPFDALLVAPLTFVGYRASILLWCLLSLVLYGWIGRAVLRELDIRLPPAALFLLAGLALCWYPFQAHIALGQLSLPLIACVVGAWLCLRRKRDVWAGALIGAACLIKLYPGLLLVYLLAQRRWRALAGAALTLALGWALTAALVGPADVIRYFAVIAGQNSAEFGAYPLNVSYTGVFSRLFREGAWVAPVLSAPWLATLLSGAATLVTVALLVVQTRRFGDENEDVAFAVACLAMLLISPITWQHVFPLLLLPFGLLLRDWLKQPARITLPLLALALVSLPDIDIARELMATSAPYRMPWYAALPLLAPTIGLLLLWRVLAKEHGRG